MKKLLLERLHTVLEKRPAGEQELIREIFFSRNGVGKTEREAANSLGLPTSTLHYRKVKALAQMRKLMN